MGGCSWTISLLASACRSPVAGPVQTATDVARNATSGARHTTPMFQSVPQCTDVVHQVSRKISWESRACSEMHHVQSRPSAIHRTVFAISWDRASKACPCVSMRLVVLVTARGTLRAMPHAPFMSASSFAIDPTTAFASPKSMRVWSSVYSSLSMPAKPGFIERLIAKTVLAMSALMIGMP